MAMGEEEEEEEEGVELQEVKEEKDSDEDVFLSKSEASGPSSPSVMPTLDDENSQEQSASTFTTPTLRKALALHIEKQQGFSSPSSLLPFSATVSRPPIGQDTPPQRKGSHGSFYSDISSENDHDSLVSGVTGNGTTSSPPIPVGGSAAPLTKTRAPRARVALFGDREEARDSESIEKLKVELPLSPTGQQSVMEQVTPEKEEEEEDKAREKDPSEQTEVKKIHRLTDELSQAGTKTAARLHLKEGDKEDYESLPPDLESFIPSAAIGEVVSPTSKQQQAISPGLQTTTQSTSLQDDMSSLEIGLSLTVSFPLSLLPQERAFKEVSSFGKDIPPVCKLVRGSEIVLRRVRERRSASVGMERRGASAGIGPVIIDEDTRDFEYGSVPSRIFDISRRLKRQSSMSLDSCIPAVRNTEEVDEDDDEDSRSTVVSLPLVFSSHHHSSPSPRRQCSFAQGTGEEVRTPPATTTSQSQSRSKDSLVKSTPSSSFATTSSLVTSLTQTTLSSSGSRRTSPTISTISKGDLLH